MKKYSWILTLLLAFTMAFVLIGCGENSSDDGDEGVDLTAGIGNLTVTGDGGVSAGGSGPTPALFNYFGDGTGLSTSKEKIVFRSLGVDETVPVEKQTGTDWDIIKSAKYLVLVSEGRSNEWGFGTISVNLQSDGNGWAWSGPADQTAIINEWVTVDSSIKKVYIVIDLTKVVSYNTFIKGTQGKINVLNWDDVSAMNGIGLKYGYFVSDTLEKPSSAISNTDAGYVVNVSDVGWPY